MTDRCDHFHDLPFSAKGTDRHTGTDDFSVSHQIRLDTKAFLCTAECQTEACDNLVKDQNRTIFCAEFPKTF